MEVYKEDDVNDHSNFGVSCSDVLIHPTFKDLQRDPVDPRFNDVRELNRVLFQLGLDVTEPIRERLCIHRNLQNQVVTCIQYRGHERTDKAWLKSGCASLVAVMMSTKDSGLRKDLHKMSNMQLPNISKSQARNIQKRESDFN